MLCRDTGTGAQIVGRCSAFCSECTVPEPTVNAALNEIIPIEVKVANNAADACGLTRLVIKTMITEMDSDYVRVVYNGIEFSAILKQLQLSASYAQMSIFNTAFEMYAHCKTQLVMVPEVLNEFGALILVRDKLSAATKYGQFWMYARFAGYEHPEELFSSRYPTLAAATAIYLSGVTSQPKNPILFGRNNLSKVNDADLRRMNEIPLRHVSLNTSFSSPQMQAALNFLGYNEQQVTEEVNFAMAKKTGIPQDSDATQANLAALLTSLLRAQTP